MSTDTPTDRTDTREGDNSLRNFFGALLAVSLVVIVVMIVIEQTAG